MQFPTLDDTIVAIATGSAPAALGVVRLSGPRAHPLATLLGVDPPTTTRRPCVSSARVRLGAISIPTEALWFSAPRSYTGQDVVELHTVGCLPLLHKLVSAFVLNGARAALPGEFTARAVMNRRLHASQADAVLDLLQAAGEGAARRAARRLRENAAKKQELLLRRLLDLLARIEAGIDFTDEEDVQFITPAELRAELTDLLTIDDADRRAAAALPHVVLAGHANAGKSTLFNALAGGAYAIVSDTPGATRDVLSREVRIGPLTILLQDGPGRGTPQDALDAAAQNEAARSLEQADLLLWVHDVGAEWTESEMELVRQIRHRPKILVLSKLDRGPAREPAPATFSDVQAICANTGKGLSGLCAKILASVGDNPPAEDAEGVKQPTVRAALNRALALAENSPETLTEAELVALELRIAIAELQSRPGPVVEEVLARIYSTFCIGK